MIFFVVIVSVVVLLQKIVDLNRQYDPLHKRINHKTTNDKNYKLCNKNKPRPVTKFASQSNYI